MVAEGGGKLKLEAWFLLLSMRRINALFFRERHLRRYGFELSGDILPLHRCPFP